MFAAVNLEVFDALTEQPRTGAELAAMCGMSVEPLTRLLEACVSLGLLLSEDGRFRNTPVSETFLTRTSPQSLVGYVLYSNNALYQLFVHLEDAVKEGTPRWQQTFGWPAPIFEHFFSTPEKMREFIMGMHGFGLSTSPAVARAFDLSAFHTIADLGAATGHLTIAACEAWPQLSGVAFDLPPVIPFAAEQIAKSSAASRISTVAGDFFKDELPNADLYALGRILHDWSEDRIRHLLRRICERLPSGGALLIAEKLLHEDRTGPASAYMQSLSMLVCTEGRERTLTEYQALLTEAGFARVEGKRTGKYLDAILASKD